jgi:hypothetical protein
VFWLFFLLTVGFYHDYPSSSFCSAGATINHALRDLMQSAFSAQSIAWCAPSQFRFDFIPKLVAHMLSCFTLLAHNLLRRKSIVISTCSISLCHQRYLEQLLSCVWDENGRRLPPAAPLTSEQKAADEAEALSLLQQLCNRHLHSFIPKKACACKPECPFVP